MPIANSSAGSIHYNLSGNASGPILLFSNSLGTTLEMWEPQLGAFESDYHVLRYDTRGHGKSFKTPGPYTIKQLASDVLALLDSLEIQKVHFCGLSLGGVIGQWLGVHACHRLSKLVISNTAAKIGSAEMWNSRISTVQTHGIQAIIDDVLARWFTQSFRISNASVVDAMGQMLASADPSGYAATCAAIRDIDMLEEVSLIKCPTLIIAGKHDRVTTFSDSQFLQGCISGAKLAALPAAHISNVEIPDQFNAAVCEFLTQHG